MAKVWMQSLGNCSVDEAGKRVTYGPAQWFQCGKHDARQFIASGIAKFANQKDQASVLDLADCGIVIGMHLFPLLETLRSEYKLPTTPHELDAAIPFPYTRTLFLDMEATLNPKLVPIGFEHLDSGWQVAIPTCGGELLAESVGSDQDREATLSVVRNLSVPLLDTRAIFMARCNGTRQLLVEWTHEKSVVRFGDPRLAFLRAYYRVQPVTCHLPAERWMA